MKISQPFQKVAQKAYDKLPGPAQTVVDTAMQYPKTTATIIGTAATAPLVSHMLYQRANAHTEVPPVAAIERSASKLGLDEHNRYFPLLRNGDSAVTPSATHTPSPSATHTPQTLDPLICLNVLGIDVMDQLVHNQEGGMRMNLDYDYSRTVALVSHWERGDGTITIQRDRGNGAEYSLWTPQSITENVVTGERITSVAISTSGDAIIGADAVSPTVHHTD